MSYDLQEIVLSYELNFWKYKDGVYLDNQEVYESASDGNIVDGLEDLPIKNIIEDIAESFSDWKRKDSENWEKSDGNGAFQIMNTPQFIRINRNSMTYKEMNKFIDILPDKYNCPLYDPEVPKRFDDY